MRKRKSHQPKISIILATYRGLDALYKPIESLKEQDFKSFEVILIDNPRPSQAGWAVVDLLDALRLQMGHYTFQLRCTYIRNNQNHYMACSARNAGIPLCSGKLVFFMHDNSWLEGSDYLTRLWNDSKKGIKGVMTRKMLHDGDAITPANGFFAHQDAVPLKWLKNVGGFDEEYDGDHGYDDFDLYQRLLKAGCEFVKDFNLVSHKIKPTDSLYLSANGERNLQIYSSKWAIPAF